MEEYRRHLPHVHPGDAWLFVTWRLYGSMPAQAPDVVYKSRGHEFVAQDRVLDRAATGPRWLSDTGIARMVAGTILAGETERKLYDLLAWVVMPNHVHILILPMTDMPRIMRWLKGWTARQANAILGRTGKPFWQAESYDHYARDAKERDRIADYIENNPVSAGLVSTSAAWPWSSSGSGGTA